MRISILQLVPVVGYIGFALGELYKPKNSISCSPNNPCPAEWPCCSPYNECGAGPICVGGCNVRSSFDEESCAPIPALVASQKLEFVSTPKVPKFIVNYQPKPPIREGNGPNKANTKVGVVEGELNSKRIIHYAKFLVTPDSKEAEKMLEDFDFTHSGYTSIEASRGNIVLAMPKKTTGSLITSTRLFLYGKASVRMKTARSRGVVTAFDLTSAIGDEIDFEWLGGDLMTAQSNYYSQGHLDYTRMQRFPVGADTWATYHTYEIDWDPDRIIWYVDGKIARTVLKKDTWDPISKEYRYPQTPMRLEIAVWPGGSETNGPGTINWAGGIIDWENSPDIIEKGQFTAHVEQITVTPYQNKFTEQVQFCIKAKKKAPTFSQKDLSRVVVSYNRQDRLNHHDEGSLKWDCFVTPKINDWLSSWKRSK
ncbi:ADM_collapsed_G0038060.mRNA.1.CDS.1 [Saccharomyces cerevisiae]|nr:ADM_collapsed_G0038060.mRNA.1.CDS.1 [Saccharomyces cerevisiae]